MARTLDVDPCAGCSAVRHTSEVDGAELVAAHGMLLQSGRGGIANLPELVVGSPISGSWWAHPGHEEIFRVLNEAASSPDVVRLRLFDRKLTLVHRRIWPALARLQHLLTAAQLAAISETHTSSGKHHKETTAFADWVPPSVLAAAADLSEREALALLPPPLVERIVQAPPTTSSRE